VAGVWGDAERLRDAVGEFGNLCGPGEALQNAAKEQNASEQGTNGERRLVRTQMSQPAEDVRVTP
jgi:hypothetical protein